MARMERKGRCKKVKVAFMEIIKFQDFVITTPREQLTKRGFPAWFYFHDQILGMFYCWVKYRATGFACFSRRRNAVSEKPRWT